MKQQKIVVKENSSGLVETGGILVSVRGLYAGYCDVVIGYPGLPNVVHRMEIGDAVLYQTTHDGVIEIRVFGIDFPRAEFLITQVSPRIGLLAGAVESDLENTPFDQHELEQVAESIQAVKTELEARKDIAPEQFQLLIRKLDEIQSAASRMGRKDWVNYVAGALTSTCISAAFAPDVTKVVFQAINSAFSWLFTSGLLLLH